jgi:hypothetical protein
MVTAKYNEKMAEHEEQLAKAREAQRKLLEIQKTEGTTPQIEQRLEKLREAIKRIEKKKSKIVHDYQVPSTILSAAHRIDNAKGYDVYKPYVFAMGNALMQYQDNLNKFLSEVKKRGGSLPDVQMSVLQQNLGDLAKNHAGIFAEFTRDTEQLKKLINDHMAKRLPPTNKDEMYLDDIVKSVTDNI